ncbi:helix-turn-helix domain-containing protein [Sphingomonas sp. LB-2]|uniref:AraC family transcriptional regulator n=1 Tax=Sphingomonas caeni TaxID=2984949 RepID=UPI00222EF31A|nr:helix-turn-helix domain-containing protein [Sphingomonas caeni]MCW3845860.1 helix-turn-helix domain-containing protein [Sphingomonas caeni]
MTRMILIDTCLRLLSVGQLLLIALVVARSSAPLRIRATTVLLLVCIASYLANVAPVLDLWQSPVWAPVQLASQAAPLLLWIFAHQILERPVDRRVVLISIAIILGCWANFLLATHWTRTYPMVADISYHLLAALLTLHAIWIAWRERGDDLIEKRRLFRAGFVILVGVQALCVIGAESWYGFANTEPRLLVVQSAGTLLTVMLLGAVLLSSNGELLFDADAAPPPRPALSPAEQVLNNKLDAAMAAHVYREPNLSIGALADRLDVPEHRLRALINQRLGYRNFSAFLNAHRIADARAWLGDPAKVDLPVLTLAMDLGYGSLAPFNRAFRDATGQTPTDYRRAAFAIPENP